MDIFQGVPLQLQIPRVELPKINSAESTPSTMSSSQTWSNVRPQVPISYQQLRKLSEWGIEALKDTSPTVVGQDRFESQDMLIDNDYRNEFFTQDDDSIWVKHATSIMRQLPYSDMEIFVDEFQYEVISSQLLTSSIASHYQLFNVQKSILNFNKESSLSIQTHRGTTVPTKYGQLFVSGKKFYLQRTVPYVFTILLARKSFRKMLYKRHLKRSSVMSILMISVYLALQQEFFHVKYSKYTALLNLRQMNTALQTLDKLIYRYHLTYKELTIYKPISLAQSHGLAIEENRTLALITDILTCTVDQLFYKIKLAASNILPVINANQLTDYTTVYNLDLQHLYQMTHTSEALNLSEKIERLQCIKKFFLCCLLSINYSSPLKNCVSGIVLKRIFPDYHEAKTSDIDRFQMISKELNTLTTSTSSFLPILHHYKHMLFSIHRNTAEKDEPDSKETIITQTLSRLSELQRHLIKYDKTSAELSSHILNELDEITKAWVHIETDKEISPEQIKIPKYTHRPSNQRVVSGGLNLDIVKTNRDNPVVLDSFPKLTSLVDVLEVDETGSDIEKDHEELVYGTETDQAISSSSDSKFSRFTDNQLRHELNQRILNLANENKKSRENLRKQKSFELMNRKIENQKKGRPLADCNRVFNSEESIPVLFELKQYLNRNE
ncbi:unnamed protein product [Kluyveromyces dobzhanskii CBS 2104]|uniref:Inheritance of peroxisomes protein 2 n=1 Tax=Kluyveromyces dobzhanskii CBS 2104 TaxID=1427455 RepID=A0A0A8L7Q8_9SACH|nr:unnamed protein product [Kluyveromyces dobzhanskii CBS 2104]